ncbi:MAG: CarD family transcriptional regulator [Candidatus Saccharibacteria bacterium]|nr:CarD family transcriptional regulator [Candidatus Saccharibacteria bacterium]
MTTAQFQKWHKFLIDFQKKSFKKGDILLFQGEAPRFAYVVSHGIVKAYNINSQGDEQLVHFSTALEVLPLPWVFNKAANALYYYEALTDGSYFCVDKDKYLEFIKGDPDILYSELERTVVNYVGKTMSFNALLYSKAGEKLINTLRYLILSYGNKREDSIEIRLRLTQQDFANLTGLTRETVSIELMKLKKAGIIAYSKQTNYTINVSKMNDLLKEQFVAEVSMQV